MAIYYMGERFQITKERFIIGRGKQTSDLTIKDPNVSRQHAMVEFLNGQYYIVDMGSTNGVEYAGGSAVYGPVGDTIVEVFDTQQIVTRVLNPEPLMSLREEFPVWQDADGFKLEQ